MSQQHNPFTRFLSQWSRNRPFNSFVEQWDALEGVVVSVYRERITPDAAERDFQRIWPWLRELYPQWEEALRPNWQSTKAGGQPTQTDPFRLLLDVQRAADIQGNWRLMQHLPAAREAINRLLVGGREEDEIERLGDWEIRD
jgi:hypothetical protein